MIELLDRAEIPMQAIEDRGSEISAIVPVHLGIAALSAEAKQSGFDVAEAKRQLTEWYNEDMTAYLGYLDSQGYPLHPLKGYEEFSPDWQVDAELPDTATDFLKLTWREGEDLHVLRHDVIPVLLYNQHDENGNFYVPEVWTRKGIFPLMYRYSSDPAFLFMEPKKIAFYGTEVPETHTIIDPVGGVAEVWGTTFNSAYQSNLAKALLLRNYGVCYLNQLAACAEPLELCEG